jgi:4-hydroxy-4-methyl-2-oxoglutarate aldolase
MMDKRLEKLVSQATTSSICDVLMKRGLRNFMSQRIRALVPGTTIWGPVRTLRRDPVGTAVTGAGNLLMTAIDTSPAGTILVFNGHDDHEAALWGGLMAAAAKARGLCGIVADGPVRDRNEIIELNQPCFCTGTVPAGQAGILRAVALDERIDCGGVAVASGDFLVGDDDGVVVIPGRQEVEILEEAVAIERSDGDAARQLLAGADLMDVMRATGRA